MHLLKWSLWLVLILLAAFAAGAAYVVATFDPEEIKPLIAERVRTATGRTLEITGPIDWTLFPRLGLRISEAALGNAPGFGDQPFAAVGSAEVGVALWPLLRREIQADKLALTGVLLNLERNAEGRDNWSDLAAKDKGASTPPAPSTPAPAARKSGFSVQISGIELKDARLQYVDGKSGRQLVVEPLNLETGALGFGQSAPARLSFTLRQAPLTVKVDWDGRVALDASGQNHRIDGDLRAQIDWPLDKRKLSAEVSGRIDAAPLLGEARITGLASQGVYAGDGIPSGGLAFTQRANLHVDMRAQTLDAQDIAIEAAGLALTGALQVRQMFDAPRIEGSFRSNAFSPKALLAGLGIDTPAPRDAQALTRAEFEFTLEGDRNQLKLKPLKAKLDDTALSGEFSVVDLARRALRFDLALDRLDIDRYRPAETPPAASAPAPAGGAASPAEPPTALPVALLRALDIDGTASIGEFAVNRLKFTDASLTLKARDGLAQAAPLAASAYRGKARIDAALDVRPAVPRYSADVDLRGVRAEEVLVALFNEPHVSGVADFKVAFATAGNSAGALLRELGGRFEAHFNEGTLKGSKLSRKVNEIRNILRELEGEAPVSEAAGDDTRFSQLSASGTIDAGVVSNRDLHLTAPKFQAKGEGRVDLANRRVDYTLAFANPEKAGKERTFIPLRIEGPFDDLGFSLRLEDVVKAKAEAALEKQKDALKEKLEAETREQREQLQKKLEEKRDELKQKLEERLGDKLKGLFR